MSNFYARIRRILPRAMVITIIIFELSAMLVSCLSMEKNQQFSDLAESLLHGKTYFLHAQASQNDLVLFQGHAYWALGPAPILLLAPFVGLFGIWHAYFYQGYLQVVLILLVGLLIIRLARRFGYETFDGLILAAGYIFGSPFIGVASASWSYFFSEILVSFLLFSALSEYFGKKRAWLLGLLTGFVLLTRVSAAPIGLFFALEYFREKASWRVRIAKLTQLSLAASLGLVVQLAYNFMRFGALLEQGYSGQLLRPVFAQARAYGLFSPLHIPGNLYYAFFATLHPVFRDDISHVLKFPYVRYDIWGLSLLITSPYLFYLFTLRRRDITPQLRNLIVAAVMSALVVFSYYGIGAIQFGYRYGLDFLPLVFVIFMLTYRKSHQLISWPMRTVIILSGVFNLFLLTGVK